MLRALPAAEREVLLAHEAAHLAKRHHLYLQLSRLAAAANPLLRPAARAVAQGVERWADEVAAEQVGDRRLAARALARAALARAAARRQGPAAALAVADDAVVERARALLAGPPRRRPVLAAVVAATIVGTLAGATVTAHDTEARFELAQSAYTATR
jgi:beta-lactamase regulating signal transducer with metallopeptidase domain